VIGETKQQEIKMTAPLIGITTSRGQNKENLPYSFVLDAYVQSIKNAGGLPVMIPVGLELRQIEALRSRLDGILLTGGGDIDPQRFGGQPHPRVYGIEAERDALEKALVEIAARTDWPFLGICRGLQMINVTLGGTLYTHTQDQLPGSQKHDYFPDYPRTLISHHVRVEASTRLAELLGGTDVPVNSLHHQAIENLAPVLRPLAWSVPDGLVEAADLPDHPFGLGVQWHPEWLQEYEPMRRLFQAFITAAAA
jgi:putative glutamine amidotransferase